MLIDTSGLLAYLFDNEPYHASSVVHLESHQSKFTHNYILAELVALAQARKYPRRETLGFLVDLMSHPRVEVEWVDRQLHSEALSLLSARPDKSYSLCDAVSFVLMKRRGVTDALTTDRHFEQEGFQRTLEPLR